MTTIFYTSFRISTARLLEHLREPLYRNGYALVFSSVMTSILGIFYWLLAARLYSAATIGLNAALLSATSFLAVLAQLNLVHALNRFLPTSGHKTKRLLLWSYGISVGVALVGSFVFLIGIQWWAPALAVLYNHWILALSFGLGTVLYCLFALQDGVLIGMREAIWVPVENLAFALGKLLLLALFVGISPEYGIYASWLIPMAVVLLPVNWLIFTRLLPKHLASTQTRSKPPSVANVVHYVVGDYFASLLWTATICLMPIIVLQKAGATAGAYYYMASTITYTLYLISLNMSMSLITEAVANRAQLLDLSYRTLIQVAKLLTPLVLLLLIGAPFVLNFFGPGYSAEATTLLRLLALSALPNIITTLYIAILRIQHRVRALILIYLIISLSILTISYLLLPHYGIAGVGIAWLASQSMVAIFLLATELRAVWLLNIRKPRSRHSPQ